MVPGSYSIGRGLVWSSEKVNEGRGRVSPSDRVPGAAMEGESVSVAVAGSSDAHSGLTIDAFYYAVPDGSIGTTPTDFPIGVAVSDTEIMMLGGLVQ